MRGWRKRYQTCCDVSTKGLSQVIHLSDVIRLGGPLAAKALHGIAWICQLANSEIHCVFGTMTAYKPAAQARNTQNGCG